MLILCVSVRRCVVKAKGMWIYFRILLSSVRMSKICTKNVQILSGGLGKRLYGRRQLC
jgi:hypothetical protein